MEASPSTHSEAEQQPAGPDMRRIVSLLPHMPIAQLQVDRPFAVACVDRLDDDVFVVFHNWVTDQFNVFKLPQIHHEPFTVFLQAIRQHDVQDVYIENLGTTVHSGPYYRTFGGGFNLQLM